MHILKKRAALLAAGCLIAGTAAAASLEVTGKGALKIDGTLFQVVCYDGNWGAITQESGAFHVVKSTGNTTDFTQEGQFRATSLPPNAFRENLKCSGAGRYDYRAEIKFTSPAVVRTLALTAFLPVEKFCGREILVNGKEKVRLPVDYKPGTTHAVYRADITEFQLSGEQGVTTFRGQFEFSIQDDRAFNGKTYTLRVLFSPPRGDISEAALQLGIAVSRYQTMPLDLSRATNAGFTDEVDGDRKGGWTDQGAENDLRMLKTGRINLNGVEFEILDPARNHGKSCIMLAGPARSYFAMRAEAVQNRPVRGRYLYVLHALAWPGGRREIGKVTVNYTDGGSTIIPVTGNVDAGNWWTPAGLPNGEVAWIGENRSAYVGLYRSNYPIEDKPIGSVVFDSSNRSIWGIVAASVGMDQVPIRRSAPFYIVGGKDWKPMQYDKDIVQGSVLDFSGRLDAPAGKYGPVVNRGGKFVFRDRPGQPVRFYGTNFCSHAQYLTREWAERLADRIAATGYNAVRFHHHDNNLVQRRKEKDRSTGISPEWVDQLDYMMACMARRGIYYTTDLYVSRQLEKGEIPEFPDKTIRQQEFKALVPVLDSAMENWKAFAKNWLNHVNPYTGHALKDDPALISLSLINENVPGTCWNEQPYIAGLYRKRFEEWKKKNRHPGLSDDRQFSLFLMENYDRSYREMKRFLREEVGVDKMLTDMNHQPQVMLQFSRNQYDYVDNHFYHDHPNFPVNPWRLPSTLSNRSALSSVGNPPSRMFATRIFGKPMMISEFDYAKPNVFRAEGPALTGAYAALQDWDALFHFAYSHNRDIVMKPEGRGGHFDTGDDIVKALSQRIGIHLFLDGEVKAAPMAFAVALGKPEGMLVTEEFSPEVMRLGLIARIGSMILPDEKAAPAELPPGFRGFIGVGLNSPAEVGSYPIFQGRMSDRDLLGKMVAAGALKTEWYDAERGICNSSSGQISLDSKRQTFKVTAPGCEVLILPEKMSGKGKFLNVDNQVGRGVFAAMSVDGRPLAESSRILLFHLTDTQANKVKFTSDAMTQMETWGERPFLARRGEAQIILNTSGDYVLYSVDTAGRRLAEIPVAGNEKRLSFPAMVFRPEGTVFAYELIRR